MGKREYPFALPLGCYDSQGHFQKEVVLRKMTGQEELLMSEPELVSNGSKLVSELFRNCIVRLGTESPVNQATIEEMSSVDRDFLLVKLRAITFGAEYAQVYSCPNCAQRIWHKHNLEKIPLKNSSEDFSGEVRVVLQDGYEDKGKVHQELLFRPPSGKDEILTSHLGQENPARAKNAILTRCLKGCGDMQKERYEALGTKIFLDLTLPDLRLIDQAFMEQMPGLNLEEEIICSHCQESFLVGLDLGNFLIPA